MGGWWLSAAAFREKVLSHLECADPEGGRGAGSPDPPPLKNHKNIGFLSYTGPVPLKITKRPCQHSMLGNHRHASETPFNGVSLPGR